MMPDLQRTGSKYLAWLSLLLAATTIVMLLLGYRSEVGPFAVGALALLALFCMGHSFLKSYAFTVWVFAFVAASMFYPQGFTTWGSYKLKNLISPLIQIIMFGMGTTLSLADFTRVLKMPWPVFIGFALQFTIMPFVGFFLAKAFGFPDAIAAGVVLIGCCPSGVASNVMAYLAGGDVALSVTITSFTTLAAPFMTPLWMKALAGAFIEVEFFKMMFDIINIIIVPIAAGLVAHRILYSRQPVFRQVWTLALLAAAGLVLAFTVERFIPATLFQYGTASFKKGGLVVGLLLIAIVTLVKLVVSVWLKASERWMDKALPIVSMAAICCIIAVITAQSRNDLLTVGPWLIGSSMIHNLLGYLMAYWLARAIRLRESACRTVAFEVGMQNGGLASALAMDVLQSAPAALASAIFGPWQNISGSILATYWHRKPIGVARPVAAAQSTLRKGQLHEPA
ncbi:MAG: bile acid:sodium symporter family protein [Planctomycetes bacterium]|jgi:BASS family bile acid:Na+ symporter|nr:bile acid:sodium symporter family protein [Planctomycetota bacterium]